MAARRSSRVREALAAIERFAPAALAESWDNVGLLIGDTNAPLHGILVAFDATTAVLEEARCFKANLVVTHHPLIFHAIKAVTTRDPIQRLVLNFVRSQTALIAVHTNLDNAPQGLNQRLAEMLRLTNPRPLLPHPTAFAKLAVFVPVADWQRVYDAMAAAGAGVFGHYSHCSFRAPGLGTFKPLTGAQPKIGSIGTVEEVDEVRLEMIVAIGRLDDAIGAMRAAHPYEEVAFDVYPLLPDTVRAEAGSGRVGRLARPLRLREFARHVQRTLGARHLRVVGDDDRLVERVAVCTGAGASFIEQAARAADVYVTGDVKHHEALLARDLGLALVDPGHATSERHAIDLLAGVLANELPSLPVYRSQVEVEPFH